METESTPFDNHRETGTSWLGALPAHWSSATIRRLCSVFSGGTPSKDNLAFWEGGTIPWLSSSAVNQRRITRPSALISEAGFLGSSAKWVPAGSVLMALAGQGKTKGMVATLEIPSTCNQSLAAIVPRADRLSHRYLAYLLP
jgi:type I restriction enzyme S subunit